jgi:hypothetical protein
MKKSPTYFLKTLLLIFGGGLLLFSGFMPMIRTYTLDFVLNRSVENFQGSISGFQSPLWYAIVILTTILVAIGYFSNGTVNRILFFVLAPIFTCIVLFLTFVFTFSIAMDPGEIILKTGKGYQVAILGALMVVAATFISVLRKNQQKFDHHTEYLLDN